MKHIFLIAFLFSMANGAVCQIDYKEIKLKQADIGISLKEAIKKFYIDTLKCSKLDEPPGVARGIKGILDDSTIVYLQIEGQEFKNAVDYSIAELFEEKIVGIAFAYTNCKIQKIGNGFVWWRIYNPYCSTGAGL